MNIVIIEDEYYAAEALEKMLLKLKPNSSVVQKITSVEDGIDYLKSNPEPDLLFCDIQLSDGVSFEIFEKVHISCPIVFITAFDQYAIQAFEVNSIDYLLKPIKIENLIQALNKFDTFFSRSPIDFTGIQQMLEKPVYKTRFVGKIGQNMQVSLLEDIAYFLSDGGITFLYTKNGNRLIVDYTLEQLESVLNPELFFRANRQLIIHIVSIQKVAPYFKGRLLLYLQPEPKERQTISQNKANDFKEWMSK